MPISLLTISPDSRRESISIVICCLCLFLQGLFQLSHTDNKRSTSDIDQYLQDGADSCTSTQVMRSSRLLPKYLFCMPPRRRVVNIKYIAYKWEGGC
ncbi:hypothetical protein BDZ91DRAFT_739516 [Kalaharituber pfeilii]|nr:hypothetical protein BDZ91DRAFT_739516 [Kalaharituber pfeilii]